MLLRLVHLLLLGVPPMRRPARPAARITRALQLRLAPDRLRHLRENVWIAETRDIPGPRGCE